MVRTPRDLLGHLYRPQKLQQQSNDISRRVHQIERAQVRIYIPLTFEEAKENEKKLPPKPKRAVTKRGHTPVEVGPGAPFEILPWGPSYAYTAPGGAITPGEPGSLGEIEEGDAVFAFYYIFDNPDGLPTVESHNVDVTELLAEEPLPVFFPSGVPQDHPDLVIAHAVKATGPGAYFRYKFGGNALGWGGRVAGAGDIVATDGILTAAAHDADVTVAVSLPFDTKQVMLVTSWGDIDAFSGGASTDYPASPADMNLYSLASGIGFYGTNLLTSGAGYSVTWLKSGSMSGARNDGYLAAAGIVVAKP